MSAQAQEQATERAWNRVRDAISRTPDAYPPLRPPAPETALRAFEEDVEVRVPEALRTLWGLHEDAYDVRAEGMRWDFMDGHGFIGLDEARQMCTMSTEPVHHGLPAGRWGRAWDPAWIPVTSRDGSTMYTSGYFVDPGGRVGSWNDDTLTESVHPSLAHCLRHIADRM
ncbi:SMI1/KNR4 family protein [Streptomyces sp. NPDC020731]|uniref:SMI1/KNR4 family protein n=1 Tax=Streptomyces sp. NPDC020731 TaxID=3365085 RepID=UPI003794E8F6